MTDVEVKLDPEDFRRLLADVRGFDRQLYKALRTKLRAVGQAGVEEVRRTVQGGQYKRDVGLRRGIAAGTSVSIRTGARTAGVSIRTTGSKLPASKQAMVRAFNKPSFRHPDFGDRNTWITQNGRPYFGAVLLRHKREAQAAIELALTDAARTIRAGRVTP